MLYNARKLRMRRRRIAKEARKNNKLATISFFLVLGFIAGFMIIDYKQEPQKIIAPIPDRDIIKSATHGAELKAVPTATPSATPTPVARTVEGEASYYSREGCLGCSDTLTMANGEILDDAALTLALTPEMVAAYKLLNDMVEVQNVETGHKVLAKVTDTGGFGKYNRVADLSVATRDAILCKSLCTVRISY